MNLGYIISAKQPGLHAWLYREIAALKKRGLKIFIFPTKYFEGPYMPDRDWFVARRSAAGLVCAHVRWLFTHPLRYVRALAAAISYNAFLEFILAGYFSVVMKRRKIERIHCHFGDRKLYVGYFCRMFTDLPLSVTIHAHELYANPNPRLFPAALGACDRIVCIAELNKKLLVEKWGIKKDKIHVIRIPGFFRAETKGPIADTDEAEGKRPLVVLCVGRFEAKKGYDILLEAVRRLTDEKIDIKLWIAGSPPPGGKRGVDVKAEAVNRGLEDRTVIFGEVNESVLKTLYRGCDLVCLLSRRDEAGVPEGIPVALIEAMSMGKPVVATSTGATSELVKEILIEEEDVGAAADAIRRLASDSRLRLAMGERNIKITEECFGEKNIDKLYDVLVKG